MTKIVYSMKLPLQPEKTSNEHLCLVPFKKEHISENYLSWLNNPTLMKYSEQRHRTHDKDSCDEYRLSMKQGNHFFWAICTRDTNVHIGNVTAYMDRNNLTANLAIMIGHPEGQGKGFGLSAWNLAMDYLFNHGVRKVFAGTMSKNKPMLAIFDKSDMTIEGRLLHHFILEDQNCDLIMAAKFKGASHDESR